jgi:hypothetical protein
MYFSLDVLIFKTGSPYVAQAGLKLAVFWVPELQVYTAMSGWTPHFLSGDFQKVQYENREKKNNFTVETLGKYCFSQVIKVNIISDKWCW